VFWSGCGSLVWVLGFVFWLVDKYSLSLILHLRIPHRGARKRVA
jgi:hypothetical protein